MRRTIFQSTRYSGTIGGSMVNVGLLILGKANNATMANENDGQQYQNLFLLDTVFLTLLYRR
jgi:hypothetical protein